MAARKPLVTVDGVTQEMASGDAVSVGRGGTELTSYSVGDLIYASGSTALSKLAAAAAGNVLRSGTSPSWGKVTSSYVDSSISVTGHTHAHSSITGLTSGDDHTQYALLAGRSGGQTLVGGTASGNSLTLQSTSHATRGVVTTVFGDALYVQDNGSTGAPCLQIGDSATGFWFVPVGSLLVATTGGVDRLVISASGISSTVSYNSPTLVTPALGTPASGVLTNCTGTASGLTAGNVTTNANLTGPITSVGNATSVASQTGTGTKFVMDTSPTLVTPSLGVATATSLTSAIVYGGTGSGGNLSLISTSHATKGKVYLGANAYVDEAGLLVSSLLYSVAASNPSTRVATDLTGTRKEVTVGILTGSGVGYLDAYDYNASAYLPIYFNGGPAYVSTTGIFTGSLTGNVTGDVTGSSGSCTGNAATATTLQTTRTIGGSSFNGSANVTSFPEPGAIGGTTPSTIAATSLACPTFTTASGVMGFTPAAGSNFNVTLSGSGDFAVNTNQLYVDTSAGNVGIGVTSLSEKLQVAGTIQSQHPTLSIYTQLGEQFVRTYGEDLYIDVGTVGKHMNFRLSSSSSLDTIAMKILSSGNVGIGTTSPNYKTTIDDTTGNYFALALLSLSIGTPGNWIGQLYGYTGSTYQKAATIFESMDSNARGKFHIALNDAANSGNVTLSDSKVTVLYTGNVGIGTTSPTALMHLGASTTARASLCIPSGTAPTSPVNGDIWSDGSNLLVRLGGTTYTLTKA